MFDGSQDYRTEGPSRFQELCVIISQTNKYVGLSFSDASTPKGHWVKFHFCKTWNEFKDGAIAHSVKVSRPLGCQAVLDAMCVKLNLQQGNTDYNLFTTNGGRVSNDEASRGRY